MQTRTPSPGTDAADLLQVLPALGAEHREVDQQRVQLHRHQLLGRDAAREHAVLPAGALEALAEDREEAAVGVDHRQPDGACLVSHRGLPFAALMIGPRLGAQRRLPERGFTGFSQAKSGFCSPDRYSGLRMFTPPGGPRGEASPLTRFLSRQRARPLPAPGRALFFDGAQPHRSRGADNRRVAHAHHGHTPRPLGRRRLAQAGGRAGADPRLHGGRGGGRHRRRLAGAALRRRPHAHRRGRDRAGPVRAAPGAAAAQRRLHLRARSAPRSSRPR